MLYIFCFLIIFWINNKYIINGNINRKVVNICVNIFVIVVNDNWELFVGFLILLVGMNLEYIKM